MKISDIISEANGGLPVKTLKGLFHVGTLDASKKRDGFEGAGLSVSTHPDAWKRIAKGHVTGDTYSATKEDNRFLDAHSLTKEHKTEITQWAIKNGYLEQQETVTVCYYDDEMEDNLCQTFDSMADAEYEYDDELQYMDVTVDKGGIVPTEKLKKETRQTRMSATGVLEFVLPIFAEQQGLDGVWWQDTLDVNRYSAPRGVIVPSKIKSWKFTVNEDLRAWFGKGKKGGAGGGGWDRYNTKGERIGKCGDSKAGEGKPKCLSKSAAAKLRNADKDGDGKKDGKAGIARAVKRKKSKDPNRDRKGKAKNVKN